MVNTFLLQPHNTEEIETYRQEALDELGEFFGFSWTRNSPKVFIVNDRETINMLNNKETENWMLGWSWGRHAIFILNPDNISKESCYDKDTYNVRQLIKHELCHCFFHVSFGKCNFSWLKEGVSIFTAGQLSRYKMPNAFKGFLDDKNIYVESGNAIKVLIDNYGKEKLFTFLSRQVDIVTTNDLGHIFHQIYGVDMSYETFNSLKSRHVTEIK